MSRYIKLEDALNVCRLKPIIENGTTTGVGYPTPEEIIYELSYLPTIDIVLCKDCKWSDPNQEGDYDCKRRIPIFRVDADGWCYLGERTEE